jgi:hypothetical protein
LYPADGRPSAIHVHEQRRNVRRHAEDLQAPGVQTAAGTPYFETHPGPCRPRWDIEAHALPGRFRGWGGRTVDGGFLAEPHRLEPQRLAKPPLELGPKRGLVAARLDVRSQGGEHCGDPGAPIRAAGRTTALRADGR